MFNFFYKKVCPREKVSFMYPYPLGYNAPYLSSLLKGVKSDELWNFFFHARKIQKDKEIILPLLIGIEKQVDKPVIIDAGKEGNHVLVAGIQGAGKTTLLYQIIFGLLFGTCKQYLKITAMDYSKGTFSKFKNLIEVVSGEGSIVEYIVGLEKRMNERFEIVREKEKISSYNKYIVEKNVNEILPFHIILFDEFPSLDNKEALESLNRVLSQGRSAGYTFIFTAQRPCSKLVSSKIKSHIYNTACMRSASAINSSVIVGQENAKLHKEITKLENGHVVLLRKGEVSRVKVPIFETYFQIIINNCERVFKRNWLFIENEKRYEESKLLCLKSK